MVLWCPCFFILFIKVTVLLSGKRREQSPPTVGSQSSATARIEIIRILLTAAPPVDSLYRVCVLTQTPHEATRCTPLCKINSCHQGIRVTICFVCFPCERATQQIKRMFTGLQKRRSGSEEQHHVSCLVICKTLELILAWKAGSA